MRIRSLRLLSAVALAVLASCNGCSCEPSPTSVECRCSSGVFARGEQCRCTLGLLEGQPLRRRMFSDFIKQSSDVKLEGTVTVQQGAVRVWFEDGQNARHEVTARAGTPAKLAGRAGAERSASSDDVTFSLNFEAIEGTPPRAEGVAFDFHYSVGD